MDDLISRQAAIEVAGRTDVRALTVEEVTMVTDAVIDGLKALPSQPEIIRCRECKWWKNGECRNLRGLYHPKEDDFCSFIARKETT